MIAVQQAPRLRTHLRWVNGLATLADGLTEAGNKKDLLNFFVNRQRWRKVHDESFTAGKKLHQAALQRSSRNGGVFSACSAQVCRKEQPHVVSR